MKKISVMIPTYNNAATLERALKSLLRQSYKHWEAIVVNDGSSDSTDEIIKKFSDKRIKYFKFSQNQGRPSARQKALDESTGDYLTMLDADDWLMPDKFSLQIQFLESHLDVGLVSTAMYLSAEDNSLKGVINYEQKIFNPLSKPRPLPVPHAPIMVRMSIAKNRKYDISLKYSEDLDFFLPIFMQNKFAVIGKPLYVYSYTQNRSFKRILNQLLSHLKIFKKHQSYLRMGITIAKIFLYGFLFAFGLGKLLSERNFTSTNLSDETVYDEALTSL